MSPFPHIASAEIVESSLHIWRAYAHNPTQPLPFGSLIFMQYNDIITWGLVTAITTKVRDGSYEPHPYRMEPHELHREHPEIWEGHITEIQGLFLGTTHQAIAPLTRLSFHSPATPPPLHTYIVAASPEGYAAFHRSGNFLSMLMRTLTEATLIDEIIVTLCIHLSRHYPLTPAYMEQLFIWFLQTIGPEYMRLRAIAARIAEHTTQLAPVHNL